MQVTNRATTKIFDVEWSLRVGAIERTSHPSRSFKDNPGNTAMMNEVFLFDVNEPFQLDMEVTATPIATRFGTLAGFTNNQVAHLGHLQLAFSLESMDKSVRTYKLRRPQYPNDGSISNNNGTPRGPKSNGVKTDCEIVVMVGLHVLEEPIEDRSWETETIYQGNLTVMTRGSRMAAWKRYWAVLEGAALKLYDPDYQQRRDPLAIIPLAHVLSVEPTDYDKVDVGSNGFCLAVDRQGVDMSHSDDFDLTGMDFKIYAFTDSAYLKEVWNANLEEAMDTHRENLDRRYQVRQAKGSRRRLQTQSSLNRMSGLGGDIHLASSSSGGGGVGDNDAQRKRVSQQSFESTSGGGSAGTTVPSTPLSMIPEREDDDDPEDM
ncbi:hypothetical protein BG004_000913, partial [Podila humilis]